MAKKKAKPPERTLEVASCKMCGTQLSREQGPLMCPNRECVAWRGKP